MNTTKMHIANSVGFQGKKINQALDILYADRINQFCELSHTLLNKTTSKAMPNWKQFVLKFSLDVDKEFNKWAGQQSLELNSPQKALTLLRQLGSNKPSMNQLAHMLNVSYNLSVEFKEIYRRLN